MPRIFKNPNLADYFIALAEVTADSNPEDIPSIVKQYEAGRVLAFPNLKIEIDHDFWQSLPSDKDLIYNKLRLHGEDCQFGSKAIEVIPADILDGIQREVRNIYRQILPIYYALFKGYRFLRRAAACRAYTTMNTDMHFDTYSTVVNDHFARMFINLDNQPRIWHTTYTVQELFNMFSGDIARSDYETMSGSELWSELRAKAFPMVNGRAVWWDSHPRHVAFFDPGDVWIVDSRLVGHQIFYGRRALSIDFTVDVASMQNPEMYYLNLVEDFRRQGLAAEPAGALPPVDSVASEA